MLSDMLLQTKMRPPPQRPFLIPRPQLSQKLAQATTVPLTLVSAPAGFGKTTLVTNWIEEQQAKSKAQREIHPFSVAWLSLDRQDNDASRFWQYFFTAISPSSTLAEQLSQPQPPPIQALLTGLINQLTQQPGHLLFILDDVHLIENRDIYQNLAFVLENAPPTLHLIFITRADPPLSLHRFRARGQLLEIRAADLRFNTAETTKFLQQAAKQTLTDEDIALLMEQTEGWAVGLQLAALALPQQTADQHQFIQRLASSNRYILEYLAEEVLAQQPKHVQLFLLKTAVLDKLCTDLCDEILEIPQSQQILEYLDSHNLFIIPLDNAQEWYRYHHLFAALLRGHLQQQMPEMITVLHQRAAHWFAEQGHVETAVTHAFAAQDNTLAANLIEENASRMVMQGRAKLVETWLQQLAAEQTRTMPRTNLAFAQALLLRGQFTETTHYLNRAEQGNQVSPDKILQGQILALQAILADTRGDQQTAQSLAQRAIQLAAPTDITSQAMAHFALASAAREAGRVNTACEFYEKAIPLCHVSHLLLLELLARAHLCFLYQIRGQLHRAQAITEAIDVTNSQHPAAVAVYAAQANVYLEQYQLDEAEKLLQKALTIGQEGGHNAAMIQAQIINGRFLLARNKPEAAQIALSEVAVLSEQGAPAWQDTLLRSAQVSFWLAQNDPTTAAHCLAQAATPPPHLKSLLALAKARIELHYNTPSSLENAQKILEDVVEPATSTSSAQAVSQQLYAVVIEAELLLALVKSAQNNQKSALAHLQKALQLAEPEGYVLLFVEMGSPMKKLLTASHNRYANIILVAFQKSPISSLKTPDTEAPLLANLTKRETEVLRLMANGLTYQQIADEMVVSINTVRHHVKGLYSKLDVNSRAQAVSKAQALGLI